jgi:hypothetical protein
LKPSGSTFRIWVSPLSATRFAEPQLAVEVEDPARDALGVLAHQLALAGRDRDLVDVVPRRVAVVEADVDRVGLVLGHRVDEGARALGVGQVARGRRVAAGAFGADGSTAQTLKFSSPSLSFTYRISLLSRLQKKPGSAASSRW